jgi:hypothetical protein
MRNDVDTKLRKVEPEVVFGIQVVADDDGEPKPMQMGDHRAHISGTGPLARISADLESNKRMVGAPRGYRQPGTTTPIAEAPCLSPISLPKP